LVRELSSTLNLRAIQIVNIVPGSGGSFYCGNCLRDSEYLYGLKRAGIEVLKVPMYLPIFADEHDLDEVPVFYGAISLYLRHSFPVFRNAPGWVDKILNSGPALRIAAGMAGSTNAKGLEGMTISMLLGEAGDQKRELDHMIDWMEKHCRADVIHLSNALLIGLARRIRERLDVKVVCTLQDEDVWVDAMDEDFRQKTWDLMKERARDVDAFFAVSEYFAGQMQPRLNIGDEKLFVQHITVDPADYTYENAFEKPQNIGYISRLCQSNGLELLIDAFIRLKTDPQWHETRLIITGGSTGEDAPFLRAIRKKISRSGLDPAVEFHKDFELGRHDFFKKVALISVPVLKGEAFGMYLLESMASGVPVVQPALGAFPEIIEKSGGGITYQPNTPEKLAEAWSALLGNRDQLRRLSEAGRLGVEEKFNIHRQVPDIVQLYRTLKNR
jgi:glycosyltransferase involved in cell wall biosynthesis